MSELIQDVRYGARVLLRKPGFALVALLTLTLGIGANTAIFSLVNAVLLRPLPFKDPDRLMLIKESLPKLGWFDSYTAPGEFLDYKKNNTVFEDLACFTDLNVNLTGQGEALRVPITRVSASLFPLLGVVPVQGRTFTEREELPGSERVALLGAAIWKKTFGSDPNVIGRVIRLDEKPFTIVGVMPQGFEFPLTQNPFSRPAEIWIPLVLSDQEKAIRASDFQYGAIGRLKPGMSMHQAQSDITAVCEGFQREHPEIYSDVTIVATVVNLKGDAVKGVDSFLLILLGAVGLVLLIACANLTNLLLGRAVTRKKEIAIRCALGASTARIVRQLLTESLILSVAGGLCGLFVAEWSGDLLQRFGPSSIPRLHEAGLDWSVLGFTTAVSIFTGFLFGLIPAIQGSRLNLNDVLKDASRSATGGREAGHLRSALVVFETAAALVLLIGAGLLINSFGRLLSVPPGFNPSGVVVAQTAMPPASYPTVRDLKTAHRRILDRLASLPGVEAVGATTNLPLVGDRGIGFIIEGDQSNSVNTAYNAWVSNDYFRAMGIQLRIGRVFADDDREDTQPVVVINETMQRRFWPAGDAIGKRVKWGGWGNTWLTIVGIVADVKVSTLEAETNPAIYMPMFQMPRARAYAIYVVRSSTPASSLPELVRREIKEVDAGLPVFDLRTMDAVLSASVQSRRFAMLLISIFAGSALLLASVGLYGVISYSVTARTREIGIRLALGASRADVLKMVIVRGMSLALAGVIVGLGAALLVTRFMKALLFEISATDTTTFTGISLLLATVALLACWIPARRATSLDPMIVLRYE